MQAAPYRVMGILNVTPDSFSDGGEWFDGDAAVAHGRELVAQGAAILDVGGESTRPGADPVPVEEELARVVPVVAALAADGAAQVSVDTMKAAVAAAALEAGATYVNDVTALRHDPGMAGLVAAAGCDVCLMHMLGEPRTMQRDPRYGDVVDDVRAFLAGARRARARAPGSTRPASRSTRASGSARRSSTTSSSCAAWTRSPASASRSSWAPRGSRSWGGSRAARTPTTASPRRSPRRSSASSAAPASSGSTTSPRPPMRSRWRLLRSAAHDGRPRRRARGRVRLRRRRRRRGRPPETEVTVEVTGLSLYTHHGVSAAEREVGQRLVLDLRLEVGEADATVTDLVEHTVDYGAVCERVALVAQQRSYRTLERLCSASPTACSRTSRPRRSGSRRRSPSRRSRCPWSPSRSRCGDSAGSRGGRGLRRGHGGRAGGRRAEGVYEAVCSTAWSAPRGPNGGYLAAIVLRAMQAVAGDPSRHPRSLTCHYLRPPTDGPVRIEVVVEREGRSVTVLSARLLQGGRPCVVALAALSRDFAAPRTGRSRRPRRRRPGSSSRGPPTRARRRSPTA